MEIKLPMDEDAELAIIGCCLLGGIEIAADAIEALPSSAFTREDCQQALAVIESLVTRQAPVDLVTVAAEWRKLHQAQIPPLIVGSPDKAPSASNLSWHVDAVMDAWRRRRLIYAGDEIMRQAQDRSKTVDSIIADAEGQLSFDEARTVEVDDGRACARLLIAELERRFERKGMSGMATGFHEFDRLTDGLQTGEVTIIAARPSVGKTSFVMNVVERVCLFDEIPTLFVSLEMSREELLMRLLSSVSDISLTVLRSGLFNEAQFAKFTSFQSRIKNSKLLLIEALGGINTQQLAGIVRRSCRRYGVKLIVLDYLQKVRPAARHERKTYEVAEVSGGLKSLARKCGAAMLAVAQLSRESEKEKGRMPKLSDLAHSGQIEFDADTVGLLHRDFAGNGGKTGTLIVAKQRNGETGMVKLDWDGPHCRFLNPSEGETD